MLGCGCGQVDVLDAYGDMEEDEIPDSYVKLHMDVAGRTDDKQTEVITSLQGQLADVSTQLTALQAKQTLDAATAFVDRAIEEGRVGVKPQRDTYIAMHQENPQRTEALIGSMAKVGFTSIHAQRDVPNRTADLDDADTSVISLMGLDPAAFKKTRADELGIEVEAA